MQHLGTLTFARAVVQALASPLAGLLGQYINRVYVIAAGAALWGAMCMGFSTVHTVAQGLPFWALNGRGASRATCCGLLKCSWRGNPVPAWRCMLHHATPTNHPPILPNCSLALLIPAAQSMTADYFPAQQRGRAFGLMHLTGAVGALLGALFATNVAHAHPLGIEGWRFAFGAVAVASWLIGGLTLAFAVDPRLDEGARWGSLVKCWAACIMEVMPAVSGLVTQSLQPVRRADSALAGGHPPSWRSALQEAGTVLRVPSFLIIVAQVSTSWLSATSARASDLPASFPPHSCYNPLFHAPHVRAGHCWHHPLAGACLPHPVSAVAGHERLGGLAADGCVPGGHRCRCPLLLLTHQVPAALPSLQLLNLLYTSADGMRSTPAIPAIPPTCAGGLIGGLLGDWAAQRSPNHGRIAVCQLSVSMGVPLSALLFKASRPGVIDELHVAPPCMWFLHMHRCLPPNPSLVQGLPLSSGPGAAALYALVLAFTGLSITWAATACNNPIFAGVLRAWGWEKNVFVAGERPRAHMAPGSFTCYRPPARPTLQRLCLRTCAT